LPCQNGSDGSGIPAIAVTFLNSHLGQMVVRVGRQKKHAGVGLRHDRIATLIGK
jgi:hypothetical protein